MMRKVVQDFCAAALLILFVWHAGCSGDAESRIKSVERTLVRQAEYALEDADKCMKKGDLGDKRCMNRLQLSLDLLLGDFNKGLAAFGDEMPNGVEHTMGCYDQCMKDNGLESVKDFDPLARVRTTGLERLDMDNLPKCFDQCRKYYLAANGLQ